MYFKIRLFKKKCKNVIGVFNYFFYLFVLNYIIMYVFCVCDFLKKFYNLIIEEWEGEGGVGGVIVNICNNVLNILLSLSLNVVIMKYRIVVILFVFER